MDKTQETNKLQEIEARLAVIEEAIRGLGQGPSLDKLQREMDRSANRAQKEKDKPAEAAAGKSPAAKQTAAPQAGAHKTH